MNDKEKYEKVREELISRLFEFPVFKIPQMVDAILSHPDICIKSDDQSLTNYYDVYSSQTMYIIAQKEMLKDGWIKPIKEVEND